jgi:ferredoxin/multimeric flavodoxin WrbA
MQTRRDFLKTSAMAGVGLTLAPTTGCMCSPTIQAAVPMKSRKVRTALVAWYSQTGNTERNGKLLAITLRAKGIRVDSGNLGEIDRTKADQYDLIVIGTPVFYYDAPAYAQSWIKSLPDLKGAATAAYVTFGGPEGNQHNAACSILECLVARNGVPVAQKAFMNMGTYPLSWAGGQVKESMWNNRHLPDKETYHEVREYAGYLIDQVENGQSGQFTKRLTMRETLTWLGPIYWTKRSIEEHYIAKDKCIKCGTCAEKCPVGAIDLEGQTVDRESCVLCFGCLNNCPAQGMYMEYDGGPLTGYLEFMKQKGLKVTLPKELQA